MTCHLNSSKDSNIENTATSRYKQNPTSAKECLAIGAGVKRCIIRLLCRKLRNKLFYSNNTMNYALTYKVTYLLRKRVKQTQGRVCAGV